MQYRILVVDDEQEWQEILHLLFSRKGWEVHTASGGDEAWTRIGETAYDLIICDLAMPGMNGMDLLKLIRTEDAILPFVVMTGVGTIQSAVEAVQMGAFAYITKPFKTQELEITATRAIEHGRMHRQLEEARAISRDRELPFVIGSNRAMQEILATINKVAASPVPVHIRGEAGTGKSQLAAHIHSLSDRDSAPFLSLDCASLPEQSLESELFGHAKGALPGASFARRGILDEARGGTVYLEEIDKLSPSTQAKLVRAVQDSEAKPLGSDKSYKTDMRLITSSTVNLQKKVDSGEFREDLFYSLAVIPIAIPALRDRQEDLILFIGHMVKKFNARYDKAITGVSQAAMQFLFQQPWKGNIRELENVIERAVLLCDKEHLTPDVLGLAPSLSASLQEDDLPQPVSLQQAVREAEKKAIQQALAITGGNRTQAANLLSIGRRTLYDKLDEYNLHK